MYHKVRQELKERYESTGRIGFFKPKDINEAYSIIETLSEVYRQQKEEPEEEEPEDLDFEALVKSKMGDC